MNHDDVPMIFRAQVTPRCNVQRLDPKKSKKGKKQDVERWVDQWKSSLPPISNSSFASKEKVCQPPAKTKLQLQLAALQAQLQKEESVIEISEAKEQKKLPSDFGEGVKTRPYKLAWRLANNSGADPSINRPSFGSQGYPFYTGSSMKGAFRRACNGSQIKRYCGFQSGNEMKPSEIGLRFHGGYPADETWRGKMIDLVHPQENKQVTGIVKRNNQIIESDRSSAMAQVTFAECKMKFGISSSKVLTDGEWDEIWLIWEKALEQGLGGRTSAGYGYCEQHTPKKTLLSVHLEGQGVASKMIDGRAEFRPNMFKATLRGHTLRLLSGLTNEKNAQSLTNHLWGGIQGGSKVGLLAVVFEENPPVNSPFPEVPNFREPIYKISGNLNLILTDSKLSDKRREELKKLVTQIIQFSMLFGGFGKSWRRVDHNLFNPNYPKKRFNPQTRKGGHQIGCHWKFGVKSSDLYLRLNDDGDLKVAIAQFINTLRQDLKDWAQIRDGDRPESSYREAWYQGKVEVWGKISESTSSTKASVAVHWLHKEEVTENLGGSTQHTGRIWHRMYPYSVTGEGKSNKYIEFLVLFPSSQYSDSYEFLHRKMNDVNTQFKKIW